MRSLIEIRARRARLEDELGAELEAEKQAESREAAIDAPVVGGRAFCHPAHRMAIEAAARELNEVPFPLMAKTPDSTCFIDTPIARQLAADRPCEVLPQGDAERKGAPMYRGLLGYFPLALFRVAQHSMISDRKHNPDTPEAEAPHWNRGTSQDHLDCIPRHLCELHTNPDYHLRAIAWRALAALQEHEERKGAAPGASAVFK